jgi:hypothetical protein
MKIKASIRVIRLKAVQAKKTLLKVNNLLTDNRAETMIYFTRKRKTNYSQWARPQLFNLQTCMHKVHQSDTLFRNRTRARL